MQSIRWVFPLPRTHTGIVMGNGNFGALIWGGERVHITINRSDFWDRRHEQHLLPHMTYQAMRRAFAADGQNGLSAAAGAGMTCWPPDTNARPNKKFAPGALRKKIIPDDFMPWRLPMGRFEFVLRKGCRLFAGDLHPASGTLVLCVKNSAGRSVGALALNMHPEEPILLIQDPQRLVRQVVARPAWEWVGKWFKTRRFSPPTIINQTRRKGWTQSCPDDPAMTAVCCHAKSALWIAMQKGDSAGAAVAAARALLDKSMAAGQNRLVAASRRWWKAYWRRAPVLKMPDGFFQTFFTYALYKFACATSPLGRTPAGLQGPWVEEYQPPPWSGDYHFNVNIQQIYTLALAAGQMEHMLPLFDMLDSWKPVLRNNARILFGIENGLALGMLTTDRGHLVYYGAGCVLDPAVSGWVAQLYWLYYRHTGDLDFLRRRAWPFMVGVMRAFEAMLEETNGALRLPLGISAEFANERGVRAGADPSSQLACIHMLADALLMAARALGLAASPAWRRIKKKLPPYTLIGAPGAERIAIWQGQDLTMCHRHHSHLSCIYPFDSLGKWTAGQRQILDNSIDHWIRQGMGQWSEWCLPWAAILQARMGFAEAPLLLLKIWKEIFVNEGLASVYLPRIMGLTVHRRSDMLKPKESSEIMQLDGAMAAATALLEFLAHQRGGVTRIFPAVPDSWRDVSFCNIRLPGPFLASAAKTNGLIKDVRITSLAGGSMVLDVCGVKAMNMLRVGKPKRRISFPATLKFLKGETVMLRSCS